MRLHLQRRLDKRWHSMGTLTLDDIDVVCRHSDSLARKIGVREMRMTRQDGDFQVVATWDYNLGWKVSP